MTSTNGLSETAQAVLDVLTATAQPDEQGRPVSTETLYRFLMQRFGLPEAQARRLRTQAMQELRDAGLVRRLEERGPRVELLDVPTDLPR